MFAHLPLSDIVGLTTLLFTHSLCARILQLLISIRTTVGTSDCQYITYTTTYNTFGRTETSNQTWKFLVTSCAVSTSQYHFRTINKMLRVHFSELVCVCTVTISGVICKFPKTITSFHPTVHDTMYLVWHRKTEVLAERNVLLPLVHHISHMVWPEVKL